MHGKIVSTCCKPGLRMTSLGFLASCSVKLNSTHVLPFVSEFQIAHVSLKNLHALLRPLWVLFEYSAFFPQSKDMHF